MNDKDWTISDWLIIFFPCIWVIVSMLLGWREYMDTVVIFGYEVSVVVIAALIAALASITGIFLKHLFIDRRQYKEILKRLCKFEDITLERLVKNGLGTNNNTRSLTGQLGVVNKSITEQLGISDISITKQVGIDKDEKSLTGQHKDIINLITIDKETRKAALNKFSKKQKDILKTTNEFKLFIEDWEKKTTEINELHNQIFELKTKLSNLMQQNNLDYPYNNEDEDEFEH